jgi:hypothetical protein
VCLIWLACSESGVDELVSGGLLTITSWAPLCSDNAPIPSDVLETEPVPELGAGDGVIDDMTPVASLENM